MSQTSASPASQPLPPSFLVQVLPLAVLPQMLLFALLATHRAELPQNLLLGAASGGFAWVVAVAGALLAHRLQAALARRHPNRRTRPSPIAEAFGAFALAVAIGSVASGFALQPPLGLLAIAAVGLPLPALAFGLRGRPRAASFPVLASALLVALVGALCLVGPPGSRPERIVFGPESADELVLLNWNVGNAPPAAWPSQTRDLDQIARTIAESGAHVVCLQEVDADDDHLQLLLQRLGPQWRGGAGPSRFGRSAAVLSRVGGEFFGDQVHDYSFGAAGVRLAMAGGEVEILSIHLAPVRNAWLRALEAKWLADYAVGRQVPVILAGDTNLAPESAWDRLSSLFTDDLELDRVSVSLLESVGRDVGAGGVATGLPARRIDRVFVPGALAVSEYEVLFGKERGRMDNRPVRVRLSLPEAPANDAVAATPAPD